MRGRKRSPSEGPDKARRIASEARSGASTPREEERFRLLIENALDLVTVLKADGTITYVSPSVRHLLGYDPTKMIGENITSFTPPEEVEKARSALAVAASRPGVTRYFELRVRHRDGSWRLHEASAYNLLDNPVIGGMVINSRDITGRKRGERLVEIQRDLSARLGATEDLAEALRISLEAVLDAAGHDCGGIYILDDASGGFELVHHVGVSGDFVETIRRYDAASPRTALVKAGEALYTSYDELPVPKDAIQLEEGLKAIAVVPIMYEGRAVGCVNVASRSIDKIPSSTRDIIEIMLSHVGQAVARIRLNAAVRESERRYRLLYDNAGEAIFTYDRDLTMLRMNRAACEKIGYKEEELLGRNVFELGILHAGDLEKAAGNLERLLAGETPIRDRLRLIRKDGSVLTIDVTSTDIFDENGDVVAVSNIAMDITERIKAEEAMRESEAYFRALIEKSTDIITILDAAGVILYESPSVERFLGYSPEELTGGNIFDYLHPDDVPKALDAFQEGLDVPGNSSYMEVRFRHKDGSWRWFGGIGSNLLQDPVVRGILLNSQDIDDRVHAEQALTESRKTLATLMSNLPGMAYRSRNDRDWTPEFVSEGCLRLTGYQQSDLIGNRTVSYGDLIHPDDAEQVWRGVQKALGDRKPFELTYRIRTASGEEKWVWEQGGGVFSEQGEVLALEGFIADITDYMRAQRLLRIQRDLAFKLSGESDLDSIVRESLHAILDATGMDSGAINLVDEGTGGVDLAFSLGLSDTFVEQVRHFDAGSPTAEFIKEKRMAFGRRSGEIRIIGDALNREGLKSLYAIPLLHEGRFVGSVTVFSHTSEDIPQRARDISEILAGQIGQAVERARLVSALRDSEQRYRLLHDNAGEAIFIYDRDLKIVSVNHMVYEKIGYSEEELLGKDVFELGLLVEDDVEKAAREIGALLSGEKEVAREVIRLRRKDGGILVVDMTGAALRDKNGVLVAISNIAMDITEQRRAEEALKNSEEYFRALIEESSDIITVMDASGTVRYVSPSIERILGYGCEYLEHHATDAMSNIHPDDLEKVTDGITEFLLNPKEAPAAMEFRVRHKDGSWRVMQAEGRNLLEDPSVEGVIVNWHDITERRRTEDFARTQLELAVRIGKTLDLSEILEESMRAVLKVAGVESGSVYLVDPQTSGFDLAYTKGHSREFVEQVRHFEADSPNGRMIGAGVPIYRGYGELLPHESGLRNREKLKAVAIVPMLSEGRVVGCICAASHIAEGIDEHAREAMEILTGQIGQAVIRARAEEALRVSEATYREIFNAASDAIFIHDMETGAILDVNSKMIDMFGYTREEIMEITIGDLSFEQSPYDQESAVRLVRAAASGEPQHFEWRSRTKEGDLFWADVYLKRTVIAGEDRVLAVVRDVSESKQAEQFLRESEERFRLLAENARDLVYRYRMVPERGFEYVSPSATAITGYTPEEHYADPDLGFKMVHPDDRHLLEATAKGEVDPEVALELRWVRKDGSIIWTEQKNALSFDETGQLIAIDGIARDITERKIAEKVLRESEERYRATFESTGTAMFLVDRDSTLSHANIVMEKVFGYSLDEVVGKKSYMDLLMPEDAEKVKDNSLKLLRGEVEGPMEYEIKARHKSGRPIDALISVSLLPGIEKSVVSLMDITEKKKYERRLEESAEQMRDFLDIAAHELRHPATLLKGYAMTITSRGGEIDAEDWLASLQAIEVGADRLVYIVEELLDASRLQRGRFSVSRQEVSLRDIAEKAAEEMRMRGSGRYITIDLPDDMDVALVDPGRLMRLFIILLDNAVKYSPLASVVELKGEKRGKELIFSVLDRGVGVSREEEEKIFERFYQAGDALHHTGPGLGLGLYIGKRIVEAHGGRIWCEQREGGGTIFTFSIPL